MPKPKKAFQPIVETVEFDDVKIVNASLEALRDTLYTNADQIAGGIVIEEDRDDLGRHFGFVVLGDFAGEVLIDVSALPHHITIVPAPAEDEA